MRAMNAETSFSRRICSPRALRKGEGNVRVKNLRSSLRQFGTIQQARDDGLIDVRKVASADNHANILTKMPTSPTEHITALAGLLGRSPELDELIQQVHAKFAKHRLEQQREAVAGRV